MTDLPADVAAAAERHGLSPGAARALFEALVKGGGRQAQFSHPELGGMGQWSGGMTQIGDMFNDGLRGRVGGFLQDVSALASTPAATAPRQSQVQGDGRGSAFADRAASANWWPADLGAAASSGSQNGMSYACFPDRRRLAIERDGHVTLYDTGDHRLTGFAQQQSSGSDLSFSGPDGPVDLAHLAVVER